MQEETKQLNESGVHPLGRAVLLRTYEPLKTTLIEIPEHIKASLVMHDQRGIVVEIGPECWKEEKSPRCVVGDRITFSKFAGFGVPGKDGQMYRCVNDRDIFMSVDEEEE